MHSFHSFILHADNYYLDYLTLTRLPLYSQWLEWFIRHSLVWTYHSNLAFIQDAQQGGAVLCLVPTQSMCVEYTQYINLFYLFFLN